MLAAHGGEVHGDTLGLVLELPRGRDGLDLSVEVDTLLAVEVLGTTERATRAGEGEHGEGDGDGEVDTNLAGINLVLELAGGSTRASEDGSTVAPRIGVGHGNGIIEGLGLEADEDRSEDLLLVASHVGLDVGDNGGVNPVATLIASRGGRVAAVDEDGGTLLLSRVDDVEDALVGLARDDGAEVGGGEVAGAALELAGTLSELREPSLGLTDEDSGGESHAALTGSTEGSTSELVEGGLLVGVRHDSAMVLGSHVGLDTLVGLGSAGVDVLTGSVGADEGDTADARLVADVVDAVVGTVDHVEHTVGETSLLGEAGQNEGSRRSLLRGLEDHGVTNSGGNGEHPEGNHGGEVERADTTHDAKGLAVGVGVNVLGELLKSLTLEIAGETACVLDDLETTENGTLGIGDDLAVFSNDCINQLLLVIANKLLELEHVALTNAHGSVAPGRESSGSSISGSLHFLLSGLGNLSNHLVRGGVHDINPLVGLGLNKLTVDEERKASHGRHGAKLLSEHATSTGHVQRILGTDKRGHF